MITIIICNDQSRRHAAPCQFLRQVSENALEKINEETAEMAITLEEVHLGSETGDVERVRANGETYLDAAQTLVK
ncbi:hypothetical protein MKP05_19525 [Halomonas sp. EGI 63088]|uniref:Uncharacterized protein n=1 Tax=Halomonas flagellata TaxID=2920385 RepID=A0ABS9RZP5_9GAMM|nr:DUF6746 family protein [Halomonas flagellata]MCH4565294.1 hypothetical protein [Halomonas flagellata]